MEDDGLKVSVVCLWRDDPRRCHLAVRDAENAAVARRADREDWLRQGGLGPRYWGMSLECVEQTIRADVAAYLDGVREHIRQGRGLLLSGAVGTGKTAILGLIAERACDERLSGVEFVHCSTLFAAFYRRAKDDAERVLRWRECSLLLLDDFGMAYAHDFPVAEFEAFCEHRHSEILATCVTTNARVEDLQESRQWARIYDRWRSTCWGYVLGGQSKRQVLEGWPAKPAAQMEMPK